jgi:hypothetical protein
MIEAVRSGNIAAHYFDDFPTISALLGLPMKKGIDRPVI